MLENPVDWQKHYYGSEREKFLARKYSYSDRCRYYFSQPEVKNSIEKLFANIDALILKNEILPGLLRQFMPRQYEKLRNGELNFKADSLVKDFVVSVIEDYENAVSYSLIMKTLDL